MHQRRLSSALKLDSKKDQVMTFNCKGITSKGPCNSHKNVKNGIRIDKRVKRVIG